VTAEDSAFSDMRHPFDSLVPEPPDAAASVVPPNDIDAVPGRLDRPIFLVGHARAGSTLLAAILAGHPDVGPRPRRSETVSRGGLRSLLQFDTHLRYASHLEQKDVWFDHCGGRDVFTHMGLELVREESYASQVDLPLLVRHLTRDFHQRRFLSKAPTNTFRMRLINALFPEARFIVLYRNGEEVVGSWGRRPYGFGRRVDWGEVKTWRLGYRRGIDVFARKWEETLLYAESCRPHVAMQRLTYRQLVTDPEHTLGRLASFLELDSPIVLPTGLVDDRDASWRRVIPPWWRAHLQSRTLRGNAILADIEAEARGLHASSTAGDRFALSRGARDERHSRSRDRGEGPARRSG
jgi:hypothetical protein